MALKTNTPLRVAVLGAGLVGERHARKAAAHPEIELVWIVDPDPGRQALATELGCQWAVRLADVPKETCEAALIATPNADHLPSGLACLERSWAVLVEKPVAGTVADAETLVESFETAGVPLLAGHHRRYLPVVDKAREMIATKALGQPVMVSVIWAVRKPESYFEKGAWRRDGNGGPLLINFIHEADLLLGLFGPVLEVKAMVSSRIRKTPVEDSAAVLLRFESGVLATIVLSDAALTPWSFEGASGENPTIAETGLASWRIGCTEGSFDFPNLRIWSDAEGKEGDWSRPLKSAPVPFETVDPLTDQLTHFAQLVRGNVRTAKVSGRDGLEALRLVEAVRKACES